MTDLADFQNRLKKNSRRLRPWAKQRGIGAFRVYDRDIPEFPLVIEEYDCETGRYVHLQEVDTGWQQSENEHREWRRYVIEAAIAVLEVEPQRLIYKLRRRQRHRAGEDDQEGVTQHGPTGRQGESLIVREGGLRFQVNLEAYHDTGLFLDHRITRAWLARRASGKRVLNLFAYTGSFTVYAAAHGAVQSDSIDLSKTYLEWAARNLALNGIDAERHRLIRADVVAWLREAVAQASRTGSLPYDLIVLDPPSFSTSSKMSGVLDTQRDHAWLIRNCLALLAPGGELLFSTNLRGFRLDEALLTEARCVDMTERTLPEDFRDRKIHRCWLITRPARPT